MARIYTTLQGDTLDLIAKREYGEERGRAELLYGVNQHLFTYGTVLPEGLKVFLPDITVEAQETSISLWD